jgi:nucleotide-binding universal stress UspA family protein
VDVDGEVRQGSIRPELMAAAKKADLLVVGSVGHGRLSGMLVGSVAEYCIRHASCPVAVVPLPAADRKSAA